MILFDLFLGFLKVGCFSFGGGYAAIPLIRDVVLSYGWMNEETLSAMIAVSESTPGPIMVNMATYVGNTQGGWIGAVLATFAVVLPAFLLVWLITAVLKSFTENPRVRAALNAMKACVTGIILGTGACMILRNCLPGTGGIDWRTAILTALLLALYYGLGKVRKKNMNPILLIILSAGLGILFY